MFTRETFVPLKPSSNILILLPPTQALSAHIESYQPSSIIRPSPLLGGWWSPIPPISNVVHLIDSTSTLINLQITTMYAQWFCTSSAEELLPSGP